MVDAPFVSQEMFESGNGSVADSIKTRLHEVEKNNASLEKERDILQVKLEEAHSRLSKVLSSLSCYLISLKENIER